MDVAVTGILYWQRFQKKRKKVSGKSVETEKKMSGIVNIKCPSIYAKAHSEPCETSKMELST